MRQNSNVLPIVCFFMSLLLLGLCYVVNQQERIELVGVDTVIKRDTIISTDTITYFKEKPVPIYQTVTKVDTFYNEKGDTVPLKTENKIYQDTLCNGEDSVMFQIAISGIKSNLDSIKADWRKSTQTITNTIEVTKYIKERKRFGMGVQTGIGYGFASKQIEPYVGVGLSINF